MQRCPLLCSHQQDPLGRGEMKTKNILVVDDSPFFIKAMSDLLSGEGFVVTTADSGEEAIERMNEAEISEPFDLLITDLVMPGLSGYDLAQFVRQKNKQNKFLPVIMLTEKVITKEEARKHGCSAYISKQDLKKVLTIAQTLLTRFD